MEALRFEKIRCAFGAHASWAYWGMPEAGEPERARVGDLSVFGEAEYSKLLQTLHTKFVLVGLNVSRKSTELPVSFRNFHSDSHRGRDYRLRAAVHETPLWGAYMTDFFVDLVDPRASRVMVFARQDPQEVDRQAAERRNELRAVGADQAVLVALGNDANHLLRKHFNDRQIIKIPHYSAYIKLPDYRDQVRGILSSEGYL